MGDEGRTVSREPGALVFIKDAGGYPGLHPGARKIGGGVRRGCGDRSALIVVTSSGGRLAHVTAVRWVRWRLRDTDAGEGPGRR